MKNFAMTLAILSSVTIIAGAQIPNNGFEDWTTPGNGLEPTGWYSANSIDPAGDYFPITRSADHFPPNVGNYSIRLENQPSLLPGAKALGIALTTRLDDSDRPLFVITGHPTSLCGYFKFLPQNGDTMDIHFALYKNGIEITSGGWLNTNAFAEWTSFNIQVNNMFYPEADSARIAISSFYSDNLMVHGNSVLYVDNLSFDVPISAINEPFANNLAFIYPNPASDYIILNTENLNEKSMTVTFYDISGRVVNPEIIISDQMKIIIKDLCNGIYLVGIKSDDFWDFQKLIIQR